MLQPLNILLQSNLNCFVLLQYKLSLHIGSKKCDFRVEVQENFVKMLEGLGQIAILSTKKDWILFLVSAKMLCKYENKTERVRKTADQINFVVRRVLRKEEDLEFSYSSFLEEEETIIIYLLILL